MSADNTEQDGGKDNYERLKSLLDYTCGILRQKFLANYKAFANKEWENTPECGLNFRQTLGHQLFQKCQDIQKDLMTSGDLQKWDLNLLIRALTEINFGQKSKSAQKIRQKIRQLKEVRNTFHHLPGSSLADDQFQNLWIQVETTLLKIGGDRTEIETLKSVPIRRLADAIDFSLDPENELEAKMLRQEGKDFFEGKEYEKCLQCYAKALSLAGTSKQCRSKLFNSRVKLYIKKIEELTTTPSSDDTLLPVFESTEIKTRQNLISLALQDAESAISLLPTFWKGYARAGTVYKLDKKWDTALVHFDKAISLNPSAATVVGVATNDGLVQERDFCRYKKMSKNAGKVQVTPMMEPRARGFYIDQRVQLDMDRLEWERLMRKYENSNKDLSNVYKAHLLGSQKKPDTQSALRLYKKGADLGFPEALFYLALFYEKGQGVERSFEIAASLYEKAAKTILTVPFEPETQQCVARAQSAMGNFFYRGLGMPVDSARAAFWYHKAIENEDHTAANNLAILYAKGSGVKCDREKAVELWKLAANRGVPPAMHSLGWHYVHEKNLPAAIQWYSASLNQCYSSAMADKSKFEAKLTLAIHNLAATLLPSNVDLSRPWTVAQLKVERHKLDLQARNTRNAIEHTVFNDHIMSIEMVQEFSQHLAQYLRHVGQNSQVDSEAGKDSSSYERKLERAAKFCQKAVTSLSEHLRDRKNASQGLKDNKQILKRILPSFAHSLREVQSISVTSETASDLFLETQKMIDLAAAGIEPTAEASDFDCALQICLCYFKMENVSEVISMCQISLKKYPSEPFFPLWLSTMLGCAKMYQDGLKVVTEGLKNFPKNIDLHFRRALLLKACWDGDVIKSQSVQRLEEAREAFQKILTMAPSDHYRVPESYYCLAHLSCGRNMEKGERVVDFQEMQNLFHRGVEAEKKLTWLSKNEGNYEPKIKQVLQDFITRELRFKERDRVMAKYLENKSNFNNESWEGNKIVFEPPKHLKKRSTSSARDPQRDTIVLNHRKMVQAFFRLPKIGDAYTHWMGSLKYPYSWKSGELESCKEIWFRDVQRKVQEEQEFGIFHDWSNLGEVIIQVQVVEDSFLPRDEKVVYTILADNYGDIFPCTISRMDDDDVVRDWRPKLAFGSNLILFNPFLKKNQTKYGGWMLDISDPLSKLFHVPPSSLLPNGENGDKLTRTKCRFCFKLDAPHRCGKCRRAFYCDRECQTGDWKLLKHSRICHPQLDEHLMIDVADADLGQRQIQNRLLNEQN